MDIGFDFFGISFESVLGLFIAFIIFSAVFNFIKFLIDSFNEKKYQKKTKNKIKNNQKDKANNMYLQKMKNRIQKVKQVNIIFYYPYLIIEYYLYLLRNNWKIIILFLVTLLIII